MRCCLRIFYLGWIVLLIGLSLSACRSAVETSSGRAPTPGMSIAITGSECPSLIVKAGDQVNWTNQESQEHQLHSESPDGVLLFDSGELQPGDTFSFTFTEAGNYAYTCSEDRASTGMVTVEP